MHSDCFHVPRFVLATGAVLIMLVACGSPRVGTQAAQPGEPAASTDPVPGDKKLDAKFDSRLLAALKDLKDLKEKTGTPQASSSQRGGRAVLDVDADGRVLVDITAEITPRVLRAIENAHGVVVSSFPKYSSLRARIPLDQLRRVAAVEEVRTIAPAEQPITQAPPRP